MKNPKYDLLNDVTTGDVLETLEKIEKDTVDITVTSPPYNKRPRPRGWLVQNSGYAHHNDHMPEGEYQEWQIKVLNELLRVTKPGGSLFYNHKIRWEDGNLLHPFSWIMRSKWCIRQEIIWDRTTVANMRGWRFWQVDERIYWLYKPLNGHLVGKELQSKHAKATSIWRIKPVPRMDEHPAPFPLTIPARAIASMPTEGKITVLDPFCGTGTTLVAAKLLDHNYIGVDNSASYVEFAKDRLECAESERAVIKGEIRKHVIKESFKERKKNGKESWPYKRKTEEASN